MQNIGTLATYNASKDEIDDAAIYVKGNVIAWVGKTADLPQEYSTADEVISMKDRVVRQVCHHSGPLNGHLEVLLYHECHESDILRSCLS